MPRIAGHHARDEWRPKLDWPENAFVQWGGGGVVFSRNDSYRTAFFEAFPEDGSAGFIRGEGKTVDDAEASAHRQWTRMSGCHVTGGHRWTRAMRTGEKEKRLRNGREIPKVSTYTNGGCFCLKCGSFKTAMPKIVTLGNWKSPLSYFELESFGMGYLRPSKWDEPDREIRRSRQMKRLKAAGINIPDWTDPKYQNEDGNPFEEDDDYTRDCRKAIAVWYLDNKDNVASTTSNSLMQSFFDSFSRRYLESVLTEFQRNGSAAPVP
jgi:hypothetical protein